MNKNQKGFSLIEVLIGLIVIGLIVAVGLFVYQKNRDNVSNIESIGTKENQGSYRGVASIWLSGATDDNFVNYYKLDYELNDLQVGCADNPTVSTKTEYGNNRLNVRVDASVKEAEETICLGLASPYRGSIDIDKTWLLSDEKLEINFNGDKRQLTVDKEKYLWHLDENNKMPFFPDNVAIIRVDQSCSNSIGIASNYVVEKNLKPATKYHKGIESLNRVPDERELIIYDDNAKNAHQTYLDEYQGGRQGGSYTKTPPECTPYIDKPILTQNMDFQ